MIDCPYISFIYFLPTLTTVHKVLEVQNLHRTRRDENRRKNSKNSRMRTEFCSEEQKNKKKQTTQIKWKQFCLMI